MMGGRGGGASRRQGNSEANTPAPDSSAAEITRTLRVINDVLDESPTASRWAKLADVRERLGGTREQQDAILTRLANTRDTLIIPEENQKTLTQRDRAAALRYGGEAQHLVAID